MVFTLSMTVILVLNIVTGYIVLYLGEIVSQEGRFMSIGTIVFNVVISIAVGVYALGYLKRGE